MPDSFTKYNDKKQELNCGVNVIPVLIYLENLFGQKKMCDIVEPLGLPVSFLLNKRNWVSYDYYIALFEKLIETTRDKRAPFKAPFSMKPQSIFEDFYYATYSTLLLGSPKQGYKLAFSKVFYKRYTKIGDFEILSSSKNTLTVKYTLKKGYKQNEYNCLAIRGFIASFTIAYGLPPANVEHLQCAAEGADSCIYTIRWEKRKKWGKLLGLSLFLATMGFEFFFYNKIFHFKDILITISAYSIIFLLIKCFRYFRKIRHNEVFNYEQNNSILDAMQKIEKNYNEILITKSKLEERNKYLRVINKINKIVTEAFHFNLLLNVTAKILLDRLDFKKGAYFLYDYKANIFNSTFQMNNKVHMKEKDQIISSIKIEILNEEYLEMKQNGYAFLSDDLKDLIKFNSNDLIEWLEIGVNNIIYMIPVEIRNVYLGFFLFLADVDSKTSKDVILSLFENISSLLKIGYQKISTRYVIENILSSIPACVLIFNHKDYKIRYSNNMLFSSFPKISENYSNDNIIGNSLFSVLPFDEAAKNNIINIIDGITPREKTEAFEINLNSIVIQYSLFNISQYHEGEKLIGIILTNITEAKSFQQKLFINEKLLALGRVASGIAHEINNPLYGVLASAEEISDDQNLSKETRGYAEEIIEHVMNVSNIIKDLSAYSKTLRKEEYDEVDLNIVIQEALKLIKYSSNFLEVDVVTKLSSIPEIKATKGEMQQIFINLFNNAIQSMAGKGKLEIATKYKNKTVFINVSDTGKGISKDTLPYIFDLFFTTKKSDEGTGQGLHIVKKIVDMYNGSIKVKSKVNNGTSFFITFPIH
ncbi:MAG: GHKL domain-containing protein [Spirochaetes bacterium]|nr:GHKL domain-containing protein [Spirochaetota bacterium]